MKYYGDNPLEGSHDRRIKIKVPIKEEEEEMKKRRRLTCQSSRGANAGALSAPKPERNEDECLGGQRANLVDPLNV